MPNVPNYACTRCGTSTERKKLTVKKALFTTMGEGARTKRARVVDWLCPPCVESDPDYQREPFSPPRVVTQLAV